MTRFAPPILPYSPASLAEQLLGAGRKVLLFGEAGIGKSTLTNELASMISAAGQECYCLGADPGSPGFGVPGAVSLGHWREDGWRVLASEALCSLDAGRFRLPLLSAAGRLASKAPEAMLLIDAPGVIRGIAAAELLSGLAALLDVDTILVLMRSSKPLPLQDELIALGVRVLAVHAHAKAFRPGKKRRANKRTEQWQAYLSPANEIAIPLAELNLIGAPPPIDLPDAWAGRQCAFVTADRTVGFGEIIGINRERLKIRLPAGLEPTRTLLVRDARIENGLLGSATPFRAGNLQFLPPPDALPYPSKDYCGGPRPMVKLRGLYATLINGVFGDPLLHLRLQQLQRSLLFDLGDSGRLPTRIAHQVSDVFITHAHIDHIGGFLWLLRSRLGNFPSCRLFGPPGLIDHIRGLIGGILWDRIGETGPRFEIAEIHDDRLHRKQLQAGLDECIDLPERQIKDGLLVDEATFCVRTVTLDHGTPVQAYAFESKPKFGVDKQALARLNLSPGPWLNELKRMAGEGDRRASIRLPDNSRRTATELAAHLLTLTPGQKLVYATDLADTEANRKALNGLAHRADILFCEASFLQGDYEQARRTGHLTTTACAEIANEAEVAQLAPFHFSKRYEKQPETVYREIGDNCPRVLMPVKNAAWD